MAKTKHHKKKNLKTLFFAYGLHLWLMVFTINVAVFYVAHFYSLGKTCFTPQQVQSDNRCLYIMAGKVYEKGTRNSPHQGHPCGTDVTSVVPPSHTGNPASYLIPTYVGDICSATTAPTTAPPPKPTNTLAPTLAPTTMQPTIARPFSQYPPTKVPSPTMPAPTTAVPHPTTLAIPTLQPTVQPTIARPYTQLPPPTATPTLGPLLGPAVSFAFALPGVTKTNSPIPPIHATKPVTLQLYEGSLDVRELKIAPTYTIATKAVYDANPSSPTYTYFVVQPTDMGASVSAGIYHIAFRTNQTPLTLVKNTDADVQGTPFHLTVGTISPDTAQVNNLLVGDLNGDDTINIEDYNIFVNCYGAKATTPACLAPEGADLNNDGVVDGIDYILLLDSIRVLQPQKQVAKVPTATPTVTINVSPSGSLAKHTLPTPHIQAPVKKITSTPPTPTTVPKTMFAGDSMITLTKVLTYGAFLMVLVIGVFAAFKGRLLNALAHRNTADTTHQSTPQIPSPAPVAQTPDTPVTAAPVPTEESVPVPKQISQVFYISNGASDPATGHYTVTLTDDSGSGIGYMTQPPPADGYYTVTGNVEEKNGAVSVSILTLTPALKPGTNF